jgi:hypothetical protein
MPITPDLPFPKNAGDPIRSKDWNDLVTETQRLDTAKVNRAGDAITGPLTIAGALAVGTTSPATKVHLVDTNSPAALRIQSTASFGQAQLEFWSDPRGSATEWRPGLIQSLDTSPGNFTGGLSFATNGTGAANRTGVVEAMRLVNGNMGIGVPAPGFKVDVGDRIRLRQGASGTAGLFLYQTTPAADQAFVGMNTDSLVGLWGKGANWALNMDVTTGNLGVRALPISNAALTLNAASDTFGLYVYSASTYGIYVAGRSVDQKIRTYTTANNLVNTTSTNWVDMPNMALSVTPAINAYFQILVVINGVQMQGSTTQGAYFQLVLDGTTSLDFTRHEFHNNGWELRGVVLSRIWYLAAGTHTIKVQWYATSGTLTCCWYNDIRQIQVIEL